MSLRCAVRRPVVLGISSYHVPRAERRNTSIASSSTPIQSQALTSILIANRGEIALSVLAE